MVPYTNVKTRKAAKAIPMAVFNTVDMPTFQPVAAHTFSAATGARPKAKSARAPSSSCNHTGVFMDTLGVKYTTAQGETQ